MSVSDDQRKRDLECLRLASECRQLASDVESSVRQLRLLRMASVWTSLTERELTAHTEVGVSVGELT
jgi:hypothetical protein